ncbi:hypothetical protein F5Y17DRAFT_36343 [Xylariaceae sp. FL0594]|nr:hypothetical protein F5Y17DRAFT_36343 [Xylariaceae sp. FL0594]
MVLMRTKFKYSDCWLKLYVIHYHRFIMLFRLSPQLLVVGYLLCSRTTNASIAAWAGSNTDQVARVPVSTAHNTPPHTYTVGPPAVHTLPASCYTTADDFEHTRATVMTHKCYTRTSVVPAATCPTLSCAPPPSTQVCPLIIKVSSVTVPCATDCCPTTATSYAASGPCPSCDPCRTPTEFITFTTGCPGTPTITRATVVTPPH